ncbi:MAG: hypothetical protein JO154_08370 [Chitinophaga sp.]|uniref:hypothetical protein n=1 Tax=Chitinophaga sp. TaxID=1869181 RepID=UPI0025C2ABF5|nr:hypothetical protein [Chitinophaga sp.]MBV8252608.1 hypothetical protein [Chitinophaga sp.]
MMRYLLQLCLCMAVSLSAMAQKEKNELHFTSSQAQRITVYKGTVFVNGNKAFIFPEDNINYPSKRNRLIEDGKSVFLFLDVAMKTGSNRLYVFNIDHSLADTLLTAVSSDVKDWDHDGNMEFGGAEQVTPYVPFTDKGADSAYYVPSRFYEIRKGKIIYDAELTEKTDIKANGVFLTEPYDANGKTKLIKRKKRG